MYDFLGLKLIKYVNYFSPFALVLDRQTVSHLLGEALCYNKKDAYIF